MVSTSHFIGDKLLMGAYAIAFASGISQSEAFIGDCGLDPNFMHIPLIILQLVAFVFCLVHLVGCTSFTGLSERHMLGAIVSVYGSVTLITHGYNIACCDMLLLEAGVMSLLGWNDISGKIFIGRVLFSVAVSKFMNMDCDGSWMTFGSFKSDVLNQPFPFTPVWHIAQLPDTILETISVLIVLSEIFYPFALLLAKARSPMESAASFGIMGLGLFYALIGNFNWTIMVLLSWAVRYIPDDIFILLLGVKTFARWGLDGVILREEVAEEQLVRSLVASGKLFIVFMLVTLGFKYIMNNDLSLLAQTKIPVVLVVSVFLWVVTINALRRIAASNLRHVIFVIVALIISRSEWLSLLSLGRIQPLVDYSGLPTCYTFRPPAFDFPVHSKKGRAGFLFQTKYSQMGTNTVGHDLGGTKYAELSVPGSVHADEQRPPFLLGHFPRIALTIWKIGTGNEKNIQEGLVLMEKLGKVVREGSDGMKVFFPNTPDSVIAAHIGKTNQIQGFYQDFTVTSRAADHQWWKRSYEKVSALPPPDISSHPPVRTRCSILVPPKIFDVALELILIMIVLGAICIKLLFSSNKTANAVAKKQK